MCSDENTSLLARKLSTKVVGINQLNFAVVMQKIPCWKSKSLSTYLFIAYSPFKPLAADDYKSTFVVPEKKEKGKLIIRESLYIPAGRPKPKVIHIWF